jgi:hypothetical protein
MNYCRGPNRWLQKEILYLYNFGKQWMTYFPFRDIQMITEEVLADLSNSTANQKFYKPISAENNSFTIRTNLMGH